MKKITLLLIIPIMAISCNASKSKTKQKDETKIDFSLNQKKTNQVTENSKTLEEINKFQFSEDFQFVINPDGSQYAFNFGSFSYVGTSGIEINKKSSESSETIKKETWIVKKRITTYETVTKIKYITVNIKKNVDSKIKTSPFAITIICFILIGILIYYFKPTLLFIQKLLIKYSK